jgi:hypothetical protein
MISKMTAPGTAVVCKTVCGTDRLPKLVEGQVYRVREMTDNGDFVTLEGVPRRGGFYLCAEGIGYGDAGYCRGHFKYPVVDFVGKKVEEEVNA